MIAWKRGSERVIFRVDIDVQHPVVAMLVRLFQPIESQGAVSLHSRDVCNLVRPANLGLGSIHHLAQHPLNFVRVPIRQCAQVLSPWMFRVSGPPLIPAAFYKNSLWSTCCTQGGSRGPVAECFLKPRSPRRNCAGTCAAKQDQPLQ